MPAAGRLSGKRALITGAGAGLGAQMARRFHQEGAEIIVNDLRLEPAERVAKEVGGTAIAADVSGATDDWFVHARRAGDRDEMTLSVAADPQVEDREALSSAVAAAVRDAVGVRIDVEVVGAGELDQLTGFGEAAKLVRFKDDR